MNWPYCKGLIPISCQLITLFKDLRNPCLGVKSVSAIATLVSWVDIKETQHYFYFRVVAYSAMRVG
jgi:hypothetical protein